MYRYTPEQLEWLRRNYPRMICKELTDAFNRHFHARQSATAIKTCLDRYKIRSGRTGRFEKGQRPWNHGVTGYMGPNRTSFRKGHVPHNTRPLWSERVGKDGYIEMSVPERNPHTGFRSRFKHKHVWLWEQAHGTVPAGSVVVFRDGNRRNFDLRNLMLVKRSELLTMNLHGYSHCPDVLKPSVLALAKLEARAGFRTRPGRGRN